MRCPSPRLIVQLPAKTPRTGPSRWRNRFKGCRCQRHAAARRIQYTGRWLPGHFRELPTLFRTIIDMLDVHDQGREADAYLVAVLQLHLLVAVDDCITRHRPLPASTDQLAVHEGP